MPLIHRVSCTECPFEREGIDGILFVVRDDGYQALCPHPGEYYTAEAVTGESWSALSRGRRFRYRDTFVCVSCGGLGYYGVHRGVVEAVPDDLIEGPRVEARGEDRFLVYGVPEERIRRPGRGRCASCGEAALHPIGGRIGCIEQIRALLRGGPGRSKLPCPACERGRLCWEVTGIS